MVPKKTKVEQFYQPMLEWFFEQGLRQLRGSSGLKNQQLASLSQGHKRCSKNWETEKLPQQS